MRAEDHCSNGGQDHRSEWLLLVKRTLKMKARILIAVVAVLGGVCFAGAAPAADNPDDVYWDNSISPSVAGLGGSVRAATVLDGLLVVGGDFNVAGDVVANHVAAWNGSSWLPLGSGMGGEYPSVSTLTIYDGKLIAGGSFTTAGGNSASYVAAWDGSSWSPLGTGSNGTASAFAVYDNQLFVGGYFTAAGNKVSAYLAQWTKPCCVGRIGNANGIGTYPNEVTISDIQLLVTAKYISSLPCGQNLHCLTEADVNQSGGANPACKDITIADIQTLVNHLFIAGPANAPLKECW